MANLKLKNNVYASIASAVLVSDQTVTLATGQGARFPTLAAGNYCYATLITVANLIEIVKVTSIAVDVLTVVRAQDGTVAIALASGDRVEMRLVAAVITDIQAGLAGMRNNLINGGMQVGQRGSVNFATTNNLYGWVDHWLISISGTTVSALGRQASGIAETTTGYALQVGNVTTTGSTLIAVSQRIEAINTFDLNSKTITVSGKVKQVTGAAQTLTIGINKPTASDNYATVVAVGSTTMSIPDSVWTPFTYTLTLGAADATNGLSVNLTYASLAAQTNTQFYFADIQLEKGTVATPFEVRSYGAELVLCQRYYEVSGATVTSAYPPFFHRVLKVTKRAVPSVAIITGSSAGADFDVAAGDFNSFRWPAGIVATTTSYTVFAVDAEL